MVLAQAMVTASKLQSPGVTRGVATSSSTHSNAAAGLHRFLRRVQAEDTAEVEGGTADGICAITVPEPLLAALAKASDGAQPSDSNSNSNSNSSPHREHEHEYDFDREHDDNHEHDYADQV